MHDVDEAYRISGLVFTRYFKREVGGGAWSRAYDEKQVGYIYTMVSAWHKLVGRFDVVEWFSGLQAIRNVSRDEFDRIYVTDVMRHYNHVVRENNENS